VPKQKKKGQKKVSKKSLKCAQTKKICVKKGSNPISPPILRSGPQFRDFTPSYGDFRDI